jgi:hypothetical protein
MTESSAALVDWLTFIVLTITLAVLVCYTVETHRLRRVAQEQLSASYRPVVTVTGLSGDPLPGTASHLGDTGVFLWCNNVGFGPALDVEVNELRHGSAAIVFESVPLLEQGEDRALVGQMVLPSEEPGAKSMTFLWFCAKYLAGRDQLLRVPVEISYRDLAGERWIMKQVLTLQPTGEVVSIEATGISRT